MQIFLILMQKQFCFHFLQRISVLHGILVFLPPQLLQLETHEFEILFGFA